MSNLFTFLDLDLDDLLSVCAATLSQPLGQAWSKRMTNLSQGWGNGQCKILKVVLKTQNAPEASKCAICIEARGFILCHQCGSNILYCSTCDQNCRKLNFLYDRARMILSRDFKIRGSNHFY